MIRVTWGPIFATFSDGLQFYNPLKDESIGFKLDTVPDQLLTMPYPSGMLSKDAVQALIYFLQESILEEANNERLG